MKKYILIAFLLYSTSVFSQTNYYSVDPSTGVSTRVGYSQPANTQPYPNSQYVPQYDLSLYERVANQKQQKYDYNIGVLRSIISGLWEGVSNLESLDSRRGKLAHDQLSEYITEISSNEDLSNDYVYNDIIQNLKIIRGNISRMTEGAIKDLRK